jgi:hypothetical protein
MYKICVLCECRVQDKDAIPSPQHEDIYFCAKCFTIQKLWDGMSIDINIDHIEEVITTAEEDVIEFDRGLKEIN